MKKEEIEYLRTFLLKEKEKTEKRLAEIGEKLEKSQQESAGNLSAYPNHIGDVGSDTEMREDLTKIASSLREKLYKINEALQKIDKGTYGYCEICGKKIEIDRLKALPFTTICIKCAKKL